MQHRHFFKRWSDEYSNINTLVELCTDLPPVLQHKIGEYFIFALKSYRERLKYNLRLKSLGSRVVLRLYKSKQKRRWYDYVPSIHVAFNMMITLPPECVFQLDQHCVRLVIAIREFKTTLAADGEEMLKEIDNCLQPYLPIELRERGTQLVQRRTLA